MKKNQPDPEVEMDGIEPARLATFGVLVGLLIVASFVLVLTLSSGARTPTAPVPEPRTAVEVPAEPANATQQRATAISPAEPLKTPGKPEAGKKRLGASSSSKASKPNKPYVISVAPGRTPRMTQVQ